MQKEYIYYKIEHKLIKNGHKKKTNEIVYKFYTLIIRYKTHA